MKERNRQVDNKPTFQARIDRGWWKVLSELRSNTGKGFKELIEDALSNTYYMERQENRKYMKAVVLDKQKVVRNLRGTELLSSLWFESRDYINKSLRMKPFIY